MISNILVKSLTLFLLFGFLLCIALVYKVSQIDTSIQEQLKVLDKQKPKQPQ